MTWKKALIPSLLALGSSQMAHADIPWAGGGKHRLSILLDARVGISQEQEAAREKGLGLLRLSGEEKTLGRGSRKPKAYLGQLGLEFTGRFGRKTSYLVDVNSQLDGTERVGVNIPEAWLSQEARWASADLKLRAGFLIPHISMEHPGSSWSTFFTLTPSAINAWIGEEVRGYGLEGKASWRLAQSKKLAATVAGFQGADTTGLLLAWRGWAMHDRQSGINERIPFRGNVFLTGPSFFGQHTDTTRPFQEMDDNLGYYGTLNLDTTRAKVNYTYWDNNTDTNEIDQEKALGWHTKFQNLGARFEPTDRRYLLQGQVMWGNSIAGKSRPARVDNDFHAFYLMYSEPIQKSRLTLRFDKFWIKESDVYRNFDPNEQDGFAVTAAVVRPVGKNQEVVGEIIHLRSKRNGNQLLGGSDVLTDWQAQAAWRYFP